MNGQTDDAYRHWDGMQWLQWDGTQWQPQRAPKPAAKNSHLLCWGLAGSFALLAAIGVALVAVTGLPATAPAVLPTSADYTTLAPEAPVTHTVTYTISGSASAADLTIATPSGTTQFASNGVPWTSTEQGVTAGQFLYISAQNVDDHGTLACTITEDGTVVAQTKSAGAYVIAACTASG